MMVTKKLFRAFRKVFPNFACFISGVINFSSKYGYYKSIKQKRPVDSENNPIPWYTYSSIDFLDQFDFSSKFVFEYSSGFGSLWWSKRCSRIVSVEDNEPWFKEISNISSYNHSVKLVNSDDDYVNCIHDYIQDCDIVIIDGSHRSKCSLKVVDYIENGKQFDMIIFDNSDWWPNATRFIQDKTGYVRVDFHGMGPINDYTSTTSVFLSKDKYSTLSQGFKCSKNALSIKSDDDNL